MDIAAMVNSLVEGGYGIAPARAKVAHDIFLAAIKAAGFKEILETHAGGTIASHCGGNTLGILYFNDGE